MLIVVLIVINSYLWNKTIIVLFFLNEDSILNKEHLRELLLVGVARHVQLSPSLSKCAKGVTLVILGSMTILKLVLNERLIKFSDSESIFSSVRYTNKILSC